MKLTEAADVLARAKETFPRYQWSMELKERELRIFIRLGQYEMGLDISLEQLEDAVVGPAQLLWGIVESMDLKLGRDFDAREVRQLKEGS